jgi:exopolysaccharide production protein ExoQ
MNPSLASLICACGIIALFYLDRDKTVRTSKALWLPVIYFWIVGSRPVSDWLGFSPAAGTNVQLNGSPLDAAVLGALLIAAIALIVRRGKRTLSFITLNWPILVYFLYCLISVAWSYHPDVAFKRWIKSIADLAMCLVIVTDPQPVAALRRVISRVGFILLPVSVLLIKYYGELGRGYTPDGLPMNTGVTTFKNELGVTVLVVSLYTVWRVITLVRTRDLPHRGRHLLAQGALLAFGVALFVMADSQTSIFCFILGCGLILATELKITRRRPALVHVLSLLVLLTGGLTLFSGAGAGVAGVMGRDSDFSGRTAIWAALVKAAPNAVVGAGFESFWISPNVLKFQHTLASEGWWHPEGLNEAHDGYLEVYLNLGLVGVGLILWILVSGYGRAVAAFRRNPSLGGLMLAYIIPSAFYSFTEAGFRMLSPEWIFLLLAIVSASGIAAGIFGSEMPVNPDTRRSMAKVIHATATRAQPGNRSPQLLNCIARRGPMPDFLPSKFLC